MSFKIIKNAIGTLFLVFLGTGCFYQHEKPFMDFMPDMVYSLSVKAQEQGSMRLPIKGTISRDEVIYHKNVQDLKNPLLATPTVFLRGKKAFRVYCQICHGSKGKGDGRIVPKYVPPPSLQSKKIQNWPDGHIYQVITQGWGLMDSFAAQVPPRDRWALVHYIRTFVTQNK